MKKNEDLQKKLFSDREKLALAYKEVFQRTGNAGLIVLRDILNELKFYSFTNVNHEDMILQKASKKILSNAGIWTPENVDNITSFLLSLEMTRNKEK